MLAAREWGKPGAPAVVFLQRPAEVEAFRAAVPKAEVRHFPDAGHNVLLDAAGEAIPAVADWLTEHAK